VEEQGREYQGVGILILNHQECKVLARTTKIVRTNTDL
jgi:hypothetical protein